MKSGLLYLLFPLGIVTGYLIPRPDVANDNLSEKKVVSPRAGGPNRPQSVSSPLENARIRSIADGINDRKRSTDGNKKPVATADIPAVIAHLLAQAGPSGLSWKARSEIDGMLAAWAREDFDSAFAWASSYPNKNAAKDFLEAILEEHARTDFDGTMALIHTLKESDIKLDLGQQLFDTAAKRSAQDAFNVLAAFPSDGDGFGGSPGEFPPGFDFKTFAELTAAHLKKEGNNSYTSFAHYPSNVLEEWAKIDSSAALDFYLSNNEIPFNDLGEITGAFLDLTKPESTYPWLAEQYTALEGKQRSKFAGSLDSVFPREMGDAPLVGLVDSLSTPALRQEMVTDMLKGFGKSHRGNNDTMYLNLLSLLPTPEERLAVINQSNMHYRMKNVSDEKLSEFGITREQLENLIESE